MRREILRQIREGQGDTAPAAAASLDTHGEVTPATATQPGGDGNTTPVRAAATTDVIDAPQPDQKPEGKDSPGTSKATPQTPSPSATEPGDSPAAGWEETKVDVKDEDEKPDLIEVKEEECDGKLGVPETV